MTSLVVRLKPFNIRLSFCFALLLFLNIESLCVFGVTKLLFLRISIISYRNLLMSWRISLTSSSVILKSSVFFCSAVMYLRMMHFITSLYLLVDISLCCLSFLFSISSSLLVFLLHPHSRINVFGVGKMLKGGGTVAPLSK